MRLFRRHKEYKLVFDELFETIRQIGTDDSCICILGDVVHAKTDISPEQVSLVSYFLKGCASLCKTILIPGNHDFNESNRSRLDSLSPIVEALNHPNLWYERDNFVLGVDGVTFSHFSIFGDKSKWKPASEVPGETKIALYHGPVIGAATDYGFDKFPNAVPIEIFDGYDMVLLGDIHRYQFLNSDKTIAYPGSLIQQDHGEELCHGMLVWDVQAKSSEFVPIMNDYGFYTYHVHNGVIVNHQPLLPKYANIKIIHENTDAAALQRIIDDIKVEHSITDLVLSKQKVARIVDAESIRVDDLFKSRDPDRQVELIKRFYEMNGRVLSNDELSEIASINRDFNSKIYKEDVSVRDVKWRPLRFSFSNMFSYGENNVIDFDSISGIIGLFAANASGKSTLFDALIYCIFDKCSRTNRAGNVMNVNCDWFNCKFEFQIGDDQYEIERRATRNKSGTVSVDVYFSKTAHGKIIMLNGTRRDDTNRIIREYIGSYDDFLLTAISTQVDNRSFIDMGQKDRQEFLYRFLDIDVYGDLYKIAKEESKHLDAQIKSSKSDNDEATLKLFNEHRITCETELCDLDAMIIELTQRVSGCNDEIETLAKSLIHIDHSIDIDTVKKQLSESQSQLITIEYKISQLESELPGLLDATGEYREMLDNINIDIDHAMVDDLKQSLKVAQDVNRQISELDTEIHHLEHTVDKLRTHEYDPNCKYCVQNQFVIDAMEAERSLPGKKSERAILIATVESVDDIKSKIEYHTKRIEIHQGILREHRELLSKIEFTGVELDGLNNNKTSLINLISKLQFECDAYAKAKHSIEFNETINNRISDVKSQRSVLTAELSTLQSKRDYTLKTLSFYVSKIEDRELQQKRLYELIEKYRVYELYQTAVDRFGVPYMILKSILPVIRDAVNDVLSSIVDFSFDMRIDDTNIDAYILYGDREWPIELVSGMERFVLSLAIRTSLIKLSILPKPNFLIIDEGFGVLDSTHLQLVNAFLNRLRGDFDFVMCVSHILEMRDSVDVLVDIDKIDGFSKITVG